MPERIIEVHCIRDELKAGNILMPDKRPSACTIEPDPSISRRTVNIRSLPTVLCTSCHFSESSAGEGVTVEEGGPPHQIIGSNPLFYQFQLERQCRRVGQQG